MTAARPRRARALLIGLVLGAARAFGIVLFWLGASRFIIWLRRRTPRVVVYHSCATVEDDFVRGLRSNVTPERFTSHLEFFARHYRVVPLAAVEEGRVPERGLAITFDDGYRSVFTEALPKLRNHGMPATVYLVSGVLAEQAIIWVNELNWHLRRYSRIALERAPLHLRVSTQPTPDEVLNAAKSNYDPSVIHALLNDIRARVDCASMYEEASTLYAGWEEVLDARAHGFTFGNHTATHPNLACLDEEAQRREIAGAQGTLTQRLGPIQSFAYPFGVANASATRVAIEQGFRSIVLAGSSERHDALSVGRVDVAGDLDDAALFAVLEIMDPVRTWLKRRLAPARARGAALRHA